MTDGFEEFVKRAARDYNEPSATPREEMWTRIVAQRRERALAPARRPATYWMRWASGVAAVLALGIGIGWFAARGPAGTTGGAGQLASAPRSEGAGYQFAAAQYLGRTDALITAFVVDARAGRSEQHVAAAARDLLSTNRLLQDSPAASDPQMRALLQDLELVLAQIAQLSAERGQNDVNLIIQGLNQSGVMVRLRTAIPAGPAVPPSQGEL